MNHRLADRYFNWLVRFIDPDHRLDSKWFYVIRRLDSIAFRWCEDFPDDENRAVDGVWLRRVFSEETGCSLEDLSMYRNGCSCFEMMVAIARRIECEILSWPGEENVPRWFWMFMKNLGFDHPGEISDGEISRAVDRWLNRRIGKDGSGGIFVAKNHRIDMRGLSMWNQMNVILNEEGGF